MTKKTKPKTSFAVNRHFSQMRDLSQRQRTGMQATGDKTRAATRQWQDTTRHDKTMTRQWQDKSRQDTTRQDLTLTLTLTRPLAQTTVPVHLWQSAASFQGQTHRLVRVRIRIRVRVRVRVGVKLTVMGSTRFEYIGRRRRRPWSELWFQGQGVGFRVRI